MKSAGARSAVEPLVSVVTPFYNTDAYLAECIESVLAQTYQNWEYVLVDNCSTDASAEIAARYVEKDPRLRLVHNTRFLAQIPNYNHALRQISPASRYCKMVQADDWIFPGCLEAMVEAAASAPDVALVGAYSLMETQVFHDGLPYEQRVVPGREMLRRYIADNLAVFGSPSCVMFRSVDVWAARDFFDAESPIDDVEAWFRLLQHGDFAFVHQVLTFSRRQAGSVWSTVEAHEPWRLFRLMLLYRYGRALFSPAEYEGLRARLESAYYRVLGRAAWERRPAEFWDFHAKGLARIGRTLDRRRVAGHALQALVDFVGNPKLSLGRLLGRSSGA